MQKVRRQMRLKTNNFKSPTARQSSGSLAEMMACRYLEGNGLRLVMRNFRCKVGEIDLVMRHNETIVFVEVRSRKTVRYGSAAESVDFRKQRKLTNAAQFFMQRYDPHLQHTYRFDVVAIQGEPGNNPDIQWISPAF